MTQAQAYNLIWTTGQDATLLGYLGDGLFHKSPVKPDNAVKPCMTLNLVPFGRQGQNFSMQNFLVNFNLWSETAGVNRQPDWDLSSVVQARIETLFNEKDLSDTNGKIILHGGNPANDFTPDADTHVWQFSFKANVL